MAQAESNVSHRIMIDCAGISTLFKNKRGVFKSMDGSRVVNAGLEPKGCADLVGITPVTITAEMVGRTIGIFTAIECKTATGAIRPEQAQYIQFIKAKGGIAGVARSSADAINILKNTLDLCT